jgi:hypothetical protein
MIMIMMNYYNNYNNNNYDNHNNGLVSKRLGLSGEALAVRS